MARNYYSMVMFRYNEKGEDNGVYNRTSPQYRYEKQSGNLSYHTFQLFVYSLRRENFLVRCEITLGKVYAYLGNGKCGAHSSQKVKQKSHQWGARIRSLICFWKWLKWLKQQRTSRPSRGIIYIFPMPLPARERPVGSSWPPILNFRVSDGTGRRYAWKARLESRNRIAALRRIVSISKVWPTNLCKRGVAQALEKAWIVISIKLYFTGYWLGEKIIERQWY